jgi:hypothetical protein
VVFAVPAQGATTVGSSLPGPVDANGGCAGASTFCTSVLETVGGVQASSPVSGIITSWTITSNNAIPSLMSLRVAAFTGPATYLGVSTGAARQVPAGAVSTTFSERLPIAAGQYIGLDHRNFDSGIFRSIPTSTTRTWSNHLQDGDSRAADGGAAGELLLQARVEPDADGDGFGDETQDACPSDRGVQSACPVVPGAIAPVLPDPTPPRASASFPATGKLGSVLSKGLVANVSVNEPASVDGAATVAVKSFKARVNAQVAAGATAVSTPGSARLVMKFDRKAKKTLAKVKKRVALSVRITVTDGSGNRTVLQRQVVLKR